MVKEEKRLAELRDKLESRLLAAIPESHINGDKNRRLAGNLNIHLPNVESEALMIALREDIAISSGSACTTAAVEPSHVLKALGLEDVVALPLLVEIGRRGRGIDEGVPRILDRS